VKGAGPRGQRQTQQLVAGGVELHPQKMGTDPMSV
jgi:hypothetical protein